MQLRQIRANGSAIPALFCIPMLIKDNIDLDGVATTAGPVSYPFRTAC